MNWFDIVRLSVMVVYTFALVMVCVYGLHRYVLVYLFYRHRRNVVKPAGEFQQLPRVTIQLPMYNEKYVAVRVIEKTLETDYPRELLQIQVLDDSTDPEAVAVTSAAVARAKGQGHDIEYIHRDDRTGYKAGALEHGLKTATGEFVTIFDADFVPNPKLIKDSIHYFSDPKICAVQTRWDHLNRDDSLLTRTQAILIDGHFIIEHIARNRSGRFMNFNGTAGTWRISAIHDAGGWQHDTLTEDMDLSYRAQMKGWKFVFLPDTTAPAELPPEMNAFKTQQFRWTKGGVQTCLKLLPRLMMSKAPLKAKIDAFFNLTCFSVHLYVLVLVALLYPAMLIHGLPMQEGTPGRAVFDMTVFSLATMSASVFYVAGQYELFRDWRTVLKYLPFLMALGVGVSLSNAKAVLEGLFGKTSEFVRTPKFGEAVGQEAMALMVNQAAHARTGKKRKRRVLPYAEFGMGLYIGFCAIGSMLDPKTALAAPFLLMFSVGFFYVSILTFIGQAVKSIQPQAKPGEIKVKA